MSQTVVNPKELYENRNTSDIFDREIIAGVLSILNKRLVYKQVWNEDEGMVEDITVPFFYDFGGGNPNSEKFIQDNYIFFGEDVCSSIGIKKIDGNFDIYPQGRLSKESVNIDSGSITNRFVLGRYTKMINGKLKSFVSFLYSIPLNYSFNVSIKAESMTTAMKIDQAFREYFFKNKTFYINYRGMKIPARIGFPDSTSLNKTSEYTMGAAGDKYITLTMSLGVESYQPVFDPTTEQPADNIIRRISANTFLANVEKKENKLIKVDDLSGKTFPCGVDVMIYWNHDSDDADLNTIKISYQDTETGEVNLIEQIQNHNFYNWSIPDNFTKNSQIDIIIPDTEDVKVYNNPVIKVVPIKVEDGVYKISPESVSIINKGYFITKNDVISGYLSYVNSKNELEEHDVEINLLNHMINEDDPIHFKSFIYDSKVELKTINLIIQNVDNLNDKIIMTNINIF